jgi:hypothetical protein
MLGFPKYAQTIIAAGNSPWTPRLILVSALLMVGFFTWVAP